ncbi:hypothetical protein ACLESO_12660 [Pyxidicoccus sp. 3LG]
MRNWMMQLGTGLSLVFAVGAPSTALAYPPQCIDVCSCESLCTDPCYRGTTRVTCAKEICVDSCGGSSTQASLTQEAREQQESDADVCTEQPEQTPSAES